MVEKQETSEFYFFAASATIEIGLVVFKLSEKLIYLFIYYDIIHIVPYVKAIKKKEIKATKQLTV